MMVTTVYLLTFCTRRGGDRRRVRGGVKHFITSVLLAMKYLKLNSIERDDLEKKILREKFFNIIRSK